MPKPLNDPELVSGQGRHDGKGTVTLNPGLPPGQARFRVWGKQAVLSEESLYYDPERNVIAGIMSKKCCSF